MTDAFLPSTIKSYRRRILTGRTISILLIVALVISTEVLFSWIETAAGAFLMATNAHRPESGAIWEQGHQSASAQDALNAHRNRRQDVQREARQAATLGQVIGTIDDEGGAMISAAHFLQLYRKLPPVLSQELVSPYTLLAHWSSGDWRRTFLEFKGADLAVYLLDAHSQVLLRLNIGADVVEHLRRGEVAIHVGLDQLSDFAGRIYSAERFFATLDGLPDGVRKQILARPADLLSISGKILRVGISGESVEGAVDLGFEVEDANGLKVILAQGSTPAVQRLKWALDQSRTADGGGSPAWRLRP